MLAQSLKVALTRLAASLEGDVQNIQRIEQASHHVSGAINSARSRSVVTGVLARCPPCLSRRSIPVRGAVAAAEDAETPDRPDPIR
jgi:hypothetical protein